MNSPAYILGFFCGLLAVAVVMFLLRCVLKKKNVGLCSGEYDERQRAIQGLGYKYAFFTLLILVAVGGAVEEIIGGDQIPLFSFAVLCMWISLCVFVTYCVWKDAYFSLRSRRKTWIAVFLIAGIVNLGISIGEGLASGSIDGIFANLVTGICATLLALVTVAKEVHDRRQVDAE